MRNCLLTKNLIKLFIELSDDENETLSFLSTRCLVNILSSGEWFKIADVHTHHDYQTVAANIQKTIMKWDVRKNIGISFLHLDPILVLLDSENEVCLEWSYFTLANLSINDTKKLIDHLNQNEKIIMEKIVKHQQSNLRPNIKNLAKTLINNWRKEGPLIKSSPKTRQSTRI